MIYPKIFLLFGYVHFFFIDFSCYLFVGFLGSPRVNRPGGGGREGPFLPLSSSVYMKSFYVVGQPNSG